MRLAKKNPGAGDAGAREICNNTPAVFPIIALLDQVKIIAAFIAAFIAAIDPALIAIVAALILGATI